MEQEIRPAHALVSDRDGESASTEVLSWILDAPTGGPLPVPRLSNRACVAVACADGQGSALTNDGSVYVWGSNDDGALLADEAAAVVTVPSAVDTLAGSGAAALSCGGHHVGVVTNGGVALTFGSNEYAALGHSADRAFRVPPRAVQGLGAVRVAQVACGPTHTVILGRGGEVFTAGSGLLGALGRGEADQSPAPRRVEALTGVPVGAVAAGDNYSCALTVTGLAYSWGRNKDGQLGLGIRGGEHSGASSSPGVGATVFSPARVEALPELVDQVACGEAHTMWVTRSGRLYGSGRNDCGQLGLAASGDASVAHEFAPQLVEAVAPWRVREVACGVSFTIVLVGDLEGHGQVFAMGRFAVSPSPSAPALMDDGPSSHPPAAPSCAWVPTRVPALSGIGVFRIAAGGDRALAVRVSRGVAVSLAPGSGLLTDFVSAPALTAAARTPDALRLLLRRAFSDAAHVSGSFLVKDSGGVEVFEVSAPLAQVPERRLLAERDNADLMSEFSAEDGGPEPALPSSLEPVPWRARALELLGLSPGQQPEAITAPAVVGPCVPVSLALESSGLDVVGLEAAFTSALHCGTGVASELIAAAGRILGELEPRAASLVEPDSLRSLLVLWLCPVNAVPGVASAIVARLCALILSLPQASRDRLMRWVAEDVPGALFGSRMVRPLLEHAQYHLEFVMAGNPGGPVAESVGQSSSAPLRGSASLPRKASPQVPQGSGSSTITHLTALQFIVRTLRLCYNANEKAAEMARAALESLPGATVTSPASGLSAAMHRDALPGASWEMTQVPLGALVAHEAFYSRALSTLPEQILYADYERWRATGFKRIITTPLVLCHYPFLLDASAKRKLLEYEAALRMSSEATGALLRSAMRPGESPFFELQVRRESLVRDVANQVAATPPSDLKKKLKVTFVGEDALDAGGVTKELFQLLVRQLLDPLYGIFVYNDSTRHHWLSPAAFADGSTDVFLVGVLLGLAIYNGVLLDVHFPPFAYKLLLGQSVGLADLRSAEPELARGLQRLLEYPGDDVEDVFCLSFTASFEAFGEVRVVDLVPGGSSIAVTAANRLDYVRALSAWHLGGSAAEAVKQLRRGFDLVVGGPAMGLFRPEELELLIAGTPHLDFDSLEAGATYEGPGFIAGSPYVQAFWRVVRGMSDDERRRLLLFVTGCAKAPIGGLRSLAFKIQRNGGDSDRLPTASTCFNTLLLPEYSSEAKLAERLRTAIAECAGFGLQ